MSLVVKERRFQGFEQPPMMLKDFLRDGYCNSCASSSSSNGIRMNPRNRSCKSMALIRSSKPSSVLLRSRSRRAAATTISAIQKVINVVKFFHFESVKPPPESNSSKLAQTNTAAGVLGDDTVKVKVKDILRWRSFRDLEEEKSTPLDCPTSPDPTTTASSSSKMSSWCDSDFTADEELPDLWAYQNDEGKKSCLEESELQQSPVSVLYSPFREPAEFKSPFHPISLANVVGAKCILTRRFNQEVGCTRDSREGEEMNAGEAEEKARELLSRMEDSEDYSYNLVMDFFMDEIMSVNGKAQEYGELLRVARSWKDGEIEECYQWELEEKRKAYVGDMEKGVNWNRFDQEQEEISMGLEAEVLDELLEDLLDDFLAH